MDVPNNTLGKLKDKVRRELVEYLVNVVYVFLVFGVFTEDRRLILAAYDITYTHYGIALIQALVLAKIIMIGSVFRFARGLEDKPLIYPTLWKTAVFAVFVGVFEMVEHVIKVIWNGEGFAGALSDFTWERWDVVLANGLVILVTFIPFFAIRELGRVYGSDRIFALFFQRRHA